MRPKILALAATAALAGCSSLPDPSLFTLDKMKAVLVAQRATWIITNPDAVRASKIGGFRTDLTGDFIVCLGFDMKTAAGSYTGIKPYNVVIGPDRNTITAVYAPTQFDPCSLEGMKPFPELDGKPAKK